MNHDAMFSGPCSLNPFIIGMKFPGLVSQLDQVCRIEVGHPEEALCSNIELFFVRPIFQSWMLRIEPMQEVGVVGVDNQKFHGRRYCIKLTNFSTVRSLLNLSAAYDAASDRRFAQ